MNNICQLLARTNPPLTTGAWVFNGAGDTCQAGFYWPQPADPNVAPFKTFGECEQAVFRVMQEALNGDESKDRASSNVLTFPKGGDNGKPVLGGEALPRFILQA